MTVKITKPEINIREKLTELSKPSGAAGEAMLRAKTPQEQFNLIGAGRKNLVINGAMNVWQRGTSTTGFSSSAKGYIADRFAGRYVSLMERSTEVPEGQPFYYSLHCTTVSGIDPWIIQGIENVKELRGQTVTMSYWIKSPDGGSMRANYFRGAYSTPVLNGSEWTYVTDTFVVPEAAEDGEYLYIQFAANKVANYYITGVQLELGAVATPFEHRSYGEELALCQRYFWRTQTRTENNNNDVTIASGGKGSGPDNYVDLLGCPEMRARPTVGLTGSISQFSAVRWSVAWDVATSWSLHHVGYKGVNINVVTAVSGPQGDQTNVKSTGSAFFYLDAEL